MRTPLLVDPEAPQPQRIEREAPPQAPTAGPLSLCQTKGEADAWAAQWDDGYEPRPVLADDLYFAAERLFELLEALADGTPAPVRLLKGSWLLERAEQLRRCRTDEERARLRLPRRQELPEAAFLSAAAVRALPRGHAGIMGENCGLYAYTAITTCNPLACRRLTEEDRASKPLKAASISHGWLTPEHPDPLGQQLVRFADQVRSERRCCPPGQTGLDLFCRGISIVYGGIGEGCCFFIPCCEGLLERRRLRGRRGAVRGHARRRDRQRHEAHVYELPVGGRGRGAAGGGAPAGAVRRGARCESQQDRHARPRRAGRGDPWRHGARAQEG
jgi:hypothetical protein